MKITSKPPTPSSNTENTPTRFGKIFSGDFLLDTKLTRWYPYFIMLFLFATLIIANERAVKKKSKLITEKEYEYITSLNNLKNNNQFISYDQLVYIKEQAAAKGLKKKEKSIYKIAVKEKR